MFFVRYVRHYFFDSALLNSALDSVGTGMVFIIIWSFNSGVEAF